MKSLKDLQVTSPLPLLRAPESEHVTSTTVPSGTGSCVVVSIVLVHSAFSSWQVTLPGECGPKAIIFINICLKYFHPVILIHCIILNKCNRFVEL